MCGIAGVARLDGHALGPEADAVLHELVRILDHRGPDERETLRDGPVGLAFTRLSLVNPQDGSQPLVSDDGNLVLIVNGEIYNHKQLAASLPGGVRLNTGSDCEVLLYLYRQYGLEFLRDVRGMFALILWDRVNNQLVLARDRFGIKPLYYHRNDQRIVLASEIKGLFADPGTPRRFDWEGALATPALAAAPSFHQSSVTTWFDGVHLVPAATILRIDLRDGRTSEHRYWEVPSHAEESTGADEFIRRYGEILEDSVRECATADSELGLFLSGGIDSSAVLALAGPRREGMHTFTVLTGGTRDNGDAEHAEWIARELGAPNHQVIFPQSHAPAPEEWVRLLWLTETPMCGAEVYYKHELHRFARQERPELRGMLLGAASDEFNGGYSQVMGGDDWDSFAAGLAYLHRNTRWDRHPRLRHWWAEGPSFIAEQALDGRGAHTPRDTYRSYIVSEYMKVQQYNVWHEDRTAAGSGIEARVPFLDHRLVELTAVVPDRLRPRLLWNKRILRDAVGTRLPDRIAERPKGPFFYGSGTRHAYRMLADVMKANSYELVERALAAPGAGDFIDAESVWAYVKVLGEGTTDSPSVEMLMRVLNMGLLAEMAAHPPILEELSAGPIRAQYSGSSVAAAEADDHFRTGEPDAGGIPSLTDGTLLLTNPVGSEWYLLRNGEIEFVLEGNAPVLQVLREIDGVSKMSDILSTADVEMADVSGDLDSLLDLGFISLGD
ncbi:asparagine synthase (glutamine-hydrolyzing) [Streptomyces sp. NPDC048254]|uniref:asparagine synthase (glutamine-hydrolyzing) n=1 Tax=Streptomyces sp. NPDC048254 TaxID=3365525 RepID=UPI003720E9D4